MRTGDSLRVTWDGAAGLVQWLNARDVTVVSAGIDEAWFADGHKDVRVLGHCPARVVAKVAAGLALNGVVERARALCAETNDASRETRSAFTELVNAELSRLPFAVEPHAGDHVVATLATLVCDRTQADGLAPHDPVDSWAVDLIAGVLVEEPDLQTTARLLSREAPPTRSLHVGAAGAAAPEGMAR